MAVLPLGFGTALFDLAVARGETIAADLIGNAFKSFLLDVDNSENPTEITVLVQSEAIRTIGYKVGGVITVQFNRGGTYEYPGTEDVFMAFLMAPSKGRFFNEHLR